MKGALIKINKENILRISKEYGIYLFFAALFVVFSILSPYFCTLNNIINMINHASIIGILSMGMMFVIIGGGIDLSIGSIVAFSGVVAASFSIQGSSYPLWFAILLGILSGTAIGFCNGAIIAKWKITPFIVTLATMSIFRGVSLVYSKGDTIKNLNEQYNIIGGGRVAGIPILLIMFIVTLLVSIFFLNFTRIGRNIYTLGGNENTAVLSGINVTRLKIILFTISGFLSGVAGVALSSRLRSGQPLSAEGYELSVISAVIIGGTSLFGGIGKVQGTFIGVMIIAILKNGLDLLNVSSYYQRLVMGFIIIIAVLIDRRSHYDMRS